MQESGAKTPVPVTMMLNTDAVALRLGQTIQAMAKEAGFDVKLQPTEFTSALDQGDAGEYDTFQIGWSGRVDPDGNIYEFVASKGSQNNARLQERRARRAARQGPDAPTTRPSARRSTSGRGGGQHATAR